MNVRKLLDWRKLLIYSHRWLGIGLGVMSVVWFISGIVLMYYGMPHLTAGERLFRMRPLDLSAVAVTPVDAARTAGLTGKKSPTRLRIDMLGDRPIYRFNSGPTFGIWTVVYADTGEQMGPMDAAAAMNLMRRFVPERAATLRYDAYLTAPDNFVMYPFLQEHLPMHRISLGDAAGTEYYVSERSGEAVMKTDTLGRILGFSGYILHRLFWWRQKTWWNTLLIPLSLLGIVATLTGLIAGVWRFSPSARFRQKRVPSHTPYASWMKWHHYAGLIFGLITFTWMFSGAVTVHAIPGIGDSPMTKKQREAITGGSLNLKPLTIAGLKGAARAVAGAFPLREMEVLQFEGKPYFIGYRPPAEGEVAPWVTKSVTEFISPLIDHDHVLVSATVPEQGVFRQFDQTRMLEIARRAMPGVPVKDAVWLHEFDSYYYDRLSSFDLGKIKDGRSLPALRVRFDDPKQTWLYLTPQQGQMVKYDADDRVNRWSYYGLHGLDFSFMFNRRPLWDIIALLLLIGGTALSMTTLVPTWKRLSKHARRTWKAVVGGRPVPARVPQTAMTRSERPGYGD
jgi:hypothetical protein